MPSSRKNLAERAIKKYHLSIRQACQMFRLSRTAYYYRGNNPEDGNVLKERLITLANLYPHYGYWKLYYLLRDEGFMVNHKKIYRLYKALDAEYQLSLI